MFKMKEVIYDDAELVADIIKKSFADQAYILGISQEEYPNYAAFETAEKVRKGLDDGDCILLAYIGEQVIGSIRYIIDKNNPNRGYINRLAVIPEFRGNDYGKVQMEYAENRLYEHGVEEVEISIIKQFTRLENYYMKLGYRFLKDRRFQSLPFEVRFLTKILKYNSLHMKIEYKENKLNVDDFQELRSVAGWFKTHPVLSERSVKGTLYSVCAYATRMTIGMARVIGDGGMTLYIQDVIVHPEYQRKGIGKKLMEYVMGYIRSSAPEGSVLQVSLMASKGKEAFYEKFGFVSRPNEKLGAGMQQRICIGKVEE